MQDSKDNKEIYFELWQDWIFGWKFEWIDSKKAWWCRESNKLNQQGRYFSQLTYSIRCQPFTYSQDPSQGHKLLKRIQYPKTHPYSPTLTQPLNHTQIGQINMSKSQSNSPTFNHHQHPQPLFTQILLQLGLLIPLVLNSQNVLDIQKPRMGVHGWNPKVSKLSHLSLFFSIWAAGHLKSLCVMGLFRDVYVWRP